MTAFPAKQKLDELKTLIAEGADETKFDDLLRQCYALGYVAGTAAIRPDVEEWTIKAIRAKAQAIKINDDVYPDIGWGMSWANCVFEAMKLLEVKNDKFYRAVVKEPL